MIISQREARRMRKELTEIYNRDRRRALAWSSDYPGGVNIDSIAVNDNEWHIVSTAQKLGHTCVVKAAQNGKYELLVYALPEASSAESK